MATRRRKSPEQIVRLLGQADAMLANSEDVAGVCRVLEISESSFHRWRNQCGGMKADDAKRLKELEKENATLNRHRAPDRHDGGLGAVRVPSGGPVPIDLRRPGSGSDARGGDTAAFTREPFGGLTGTSIADWAKTRIGLAFIPPGTPWNNGHVESFHARQRDECLNINSFYSVLHAKVVITDWNHEYNHVRRHSSLNYKTPIEYARDCTHRK